jgi:type IV fimbrial biogenesis protein FimT
VGSKGRAGFTLFELMAALAIVAILAAVASPVFVRIVRDQRVSRAAMEVADVYRIARTRAMGRGAAVLVRWNQAAGTNALGLFELREAIQATATVPLPATSCRTTDWLNTSAESRAISSFDPGNGQAYELAEIRFTDELGSAQTFAEICFTPTGRVWYRNAAGGAFQAMTGVPKFKVTNIDTTRERQVFVPPNGVARVQL